MEKLKSIILKIKNGEKPDREELLHLVSARRAVTKEVREWMYSLARESAVSVYGHDIYLRGLIEFTNYCRNNCYYCGLRRDNRTVNRYRLTREQILDCADKGYELNFRTIVLQGGEDLSRSRSGKNPGRAIRNTLMPARTAICSDMRLQMQLTIAVFTPPSSRWKIECDAFGTCVILDFRSAPALW